MAPNRYPLSTDTPTIQQFVGQLGGAANVWQPADSSLTRPNNATAYSANQVVGSSAVGIFTFTKFFRGKGSSGLLTGARLVASVASIATSNMGSITGHLFNVSPGGGGALSDQATFETLFADDSAKLGTISFSVWNIGGTGSNLIESYGAPVLAPLPIIAAAQAQELYLVLAASAAFTPIASAVIQPYLSGVLD